MIVDIVKGVVSNMTVPGSSPSVAPTFIHGEKSWQNLEADEVLNHIVFLDEPITSNDTMHQSGAFDEAYPIVLFFAEKSEMEWTPEQHQVAIQRQRYQRKKFLNHLVSLIGDTIINFGSIRTMDAKNVFDVNLSGCILYINITPLVNYSVCP